MLGMLLLDPRYSDSPAREMFPRERIDLSNKMTRLANFLLPALSFILVPVPKINDRWQFKGERVAGQHNGELANPKAFPQAGRCKAKIKSYHTGQNGAEQAHASFRQSAPESGPLTRDMASMNNYSINGHC